MKRALCLIIYHPVQNSSCPLVSADYPCRVPRLLLLIHRILSWDGFAPRLSFLLLTSSFCTFGATKSHFTKLKFEFFSWSWSWSWSGGLLWSRSGGWSRGRSWGRSLQFITRIKCSELSKKFTKSQKKFMLNEGLPKGGRGGSDVWEKFPNNPVIFLSASLSGCKFVENTFPAAYRRKWC